MQEHVKHLNEIFERFRYANLKLYPKKCQFAKNKVLYLGYYITDKGLETDPDKIKLIHNFPVPQNLKSLRSFIGLAQFYRRFIKNFSKIAAPLFQLQKKDQEFHWTPECQEAFDKLKHSLEQTPTLKYPDTTKPFILNTDASMVAISYILQQKDSDGTIRPIAFGGRTLKQAEKNWTVTELECLALLEGCKAYSNYLSNNRFTILTDHISLKYLNDLKFSNGRLLRQATYLQNFSFDIEHVKSKTNVVADTLSREQVESEPTYFENSLLNINFDDDEDDEVFDDTINTIQLDIEETNITQEQKQDPDSAYIIDYLENNILPDDAKLLKKVCIIADQGC